ncbi:MAG: pantoate--beta-alanine ligase [Dehalococcoidales bacterium]|nr:pantoate--beta-alanine ligase [Dehalococcoidales bacterium]
MSTKQTCPERKPLSAISQNKSHQTHSHQMKVIETISEMRSMRRQLATPVGFVPTMGYLHEGHLALIQRARAENASLVVSIFVNPAQFDPQEDFSSYPRNPQRDLAMLAAEQNDVVFMPSVMEIYPSGFNSWVEVGQVTNRLEGASRPGHFRGVTTVVAKLFDIVQPTRAYFGQKDAQQTIVVKKMVADLAMDLEIVTVPTVREPDGLAVSSRNAYLNLEERPAATVLYRALCLARQLWLQGEKDAGNIRRQMTALIQKESRATTDYVSMADPETLEEFDTVKPPALASLAVQIGKTRLIDNVVLE